MKWIFDIIFSKFVHNILRQLMAHELPVLNKQDHSLLLSPIGRRKTSDLINIAPNHSIAANSLSDQKIYVSLPIRLAA